MVDGVSLNGKELSMQITTLASGLSLAEGPRWHESGTLYFGDAIGSGLFTWREGEGQKTAVPDQNNLGGIVFHQDGSLICSTSKGFIHYDPDSRVVKPIECTLNDAPIGRVNDIEAAPDGSLWGGTVDHEALETGSKMRPGVLFRMDPSGTVTGLKDIMIPNGIEFSDDGTQLYFSESGDGVYVYDVSSEGQISGRRAFALMPDSDGMVMDRSGGLWIARYMTNRIEYYDADGALQQSVETPYEAATSACFGGPDLTTLYVTGGNLEEAGRGGVVSFTVEIPGREERKTSIPHTANQP